MLPSERTTTSLGEFRRLPCQCEASTVIEPSCSVRVTRRVRCSQLSSRPLRSAGWPLLVLAGFREGEHGVVRDVGPQRGVVRAEPHGAFAPARAAPQALDALGAGNATVEARVEPLESGAVEKAEGVGGHGAGLSSFHENTGGLGGVISGCPCNRSCRFPRRCAARWRRRW